MRPNFSRVQKNKTEVALVRPAIREKKQKSPRLRKSLCCSTTDTLGSYRGLNQSEIVKGGPPSDWPWSRHSCTCVRLKERSTDMGFSIADADV